MSTLTAPQLWQRYQQYLCHCPSLGLTLDISRMNFSEAFFLQMTPFMTRAFAAMDQLEAGAIANPDEDRMVGHYWLRDTSRAPTPKIRDEIKSTLQSLKQFTADIHAGTIKAPSGQKFDHLLVIGIGGSALGPEFVADALGSSQDKMLPHFLDNTDPDGLARVLHALAPHLPRTLSVVISKSGGTPETRNGMLAAKAAYTTAGLDFAKYAVAITGDGSKLDKVAVSEGWLKRFPMWDWVGGRTSELSAVGLLPAALQGIDIDALLSGARDMDEITRLYDTMKNPAALLALMWYHAGDGKGKKDMVVLPYKDRLVLFSKYLQQLVMESLGKEKDRQGKIVHQGIAVYGNKGSTDQHAYVQQLREGINNFFATFIEVLRDPSALLPKATPLFVDPNVTPGDYLNGFFQGTRTALAANGRESMTITIEEVSPRTVGLLIALFERAVGLYAELIDINAYHQPGVEAGKKAAEGVLALQSAIIKHIEQGGKGSATGIAQALNRPDDVETIHHVLRHLAANPEHHIRAQGDHPLELSYQKS